MSVKFHEMVRHFSAVLQTSGNSSNNYCEMIQQNANVECGVVQTSATIVDIEKHIETLLLENVNNSHYI